MLRPLIAFLILATLPSAALAAPDDATIIMRLVAAHEARIHADGACILRETFAASPVAQAAQGQRWTRPSAPPSATWTDNVPLPPDEVLALSEAARTILRGRRPPPVAMRLDPAWLPGFAFCAAERAGPVLGFSAPIIGDEIAFVETGFTCGRLCGNGLLYALRRGRDGWAIVAVAGTWIS